MTTQVLIAPFGTGITESEDGFSIWVSGWGRAGPPPGVALSVALLAGLCSVLLGSGRSGLQDG